jgi:hypothetical protein
MVRMHFVAKAAVCAAAAGGAVWPVSALFAAADQVKIEVTGNIVPACSSATSTTTLDAGDVTKAGSVRYSFTVDCNAPFKYTMQSDNGALRLVHAPASAARASVEVPYTVHLHIPLNGGAIDDTCASASIKQGAISCKFTDSGGKVAITQRATADISWDSPQGLLMGGDYIDRVTVSVSIKL